jgi:hypothetical protein
MPEALAPPRLIRSVRFHYAHETATDSGIRLPTLPESLQATSSSAGRRSLPGAGLRSSMPAVSDPLGQSWGRVPCAFAGRLGGVGESRAGHQQRAHVCSGRGIRTPCSSSEAPAYSGGSSFSFSVTGQKETPESRTSRSRQQPPRRVVDRLWKLEHHHCRPRPLPAAVPELIARRKLCTAGARWI